MLGVSWRDVSEPSRAMRSHSGLGVGSQLSAMWPHKQRGWGGGPWRELSPPTWARGSWSTILVTWTADLTWSPVRSLWWSCCRPPPPHALAAGTPGPCLPQPCSVCCGLQPGGSPAGGPGACAIIQGGGAGACTPQGGLVLDGDDAVWGGLQNRAAPWPVNVQAESALGQLWTFHVQPGTWPASGTF